MNISRKSCEEVIIYCIVSSIISWIIILFMGYIFSFWGNAFFIDFLFNPMTWLALAAITPLGTKIGALIMSKKEETIPRIVSDIICLSVGVSMQIAAVIFSLLLHIKLVILE